MGTSVVALSKQSQVSNPNRNPKSQSYVMSRSGYPSTHGHTPSYRSAASTVYPSALGADTNFSSGLGSSSMRSTGLSDMERDMARHLSSSSSLSTTRSPLTGSTGHSGSSSTYKTEKYSSSLSSVNGGLPHRESHHDLTYRSTRVGDSGIPHTSYGHSSPSYDS